MSIPPRPDRSEFGGVDLSDFSREPRIDWPFIWTLVAMAVTPLIMLYVIGRLLLAVIR